LKKHVVAVGAGGGKAARRCAVAVLSAATSTGLKTKAGADAAMGRLTIAGRDFATVTKHRGDQPNAEAVADAGIAALKALQAIDWNVVVPPTKGTVDFDEAIGTLQQGDAESVRMVQVRRKGVSTKAGAAVPVALTGPLVGLVRAGEATFKAGAAVGYAPFTVAPVTPGVMEADPVQGQAALGGTDTLDPGSAAVQSFTVVPAGVVVPPPPPPPPANVFHLSGLDLGPLKFLLGYSMGVKLPDKATWSKAIGRPPLCCSGGSHSAKRTATWENVRGGAKGSIGKGTQLDVAGHSTNLSDALDIVEPGTAQLLVATWRTVPDNVKSSDYVDLANGSHDGDAYIMGWNAWVMMHGRGYRGAQLVVRGDKEYNGDGYGVSAQNAPQRAAWLARFIANFNKGYLDAGADDRPRHVLGLARHAYLGPLEAHVPIGPGGQVMVDAIDISMHPPDTLDELAGKPPAVQVAGVREWIRGGYERGRDCYAPDHGDPTRSGLVVAKAHGILISNFETSPRDDEHACQVSAAAWDALFDFWTEHADMVGGVGVYNDTCLNRELRVNGQPVPGWADGVDTFVRRARGG
jgi:hypothetical protein